MTTPDDLPALYALLHKVYQGYADKPDDVGEYEARVFDFQFHMRECVRDFTEFARILSAPPAPPDKESVMAIWSCLIHMLPHLHAAYIALHRKQVPNPFEDTPPFSPDRVKKAKAFRRVKKS